MELKIDSWGLVIESGIFDLAIQRSAIITLAVIYVALKARQFYLARTAKPSETPRTRQTRKPE